MKYVPALLIAVVVISLGGFSFTLFQVDTMARIISDVRGDLLPRELEVAPSAKGPLEVTVNGQQQLCVELKKTVNIIEIAYPCCKDPDESFEEFGARCRDEFAAFCEGFEGR